MTGVRYKIPMLSAKAILAYAKPVGEDIYSFNLNKAETASALLNHGETYQDDNAVFYQLMSMLHRDGYSPNGDELIIDDLYDAIIYLDFAGIFDRSAEFPKNALRQKKAESMFRPEGITLDLGSGQHKYLAFERSASMSLSEITAEDLMFYQSLKMNALKQMSFMLPVPYIQSKTFMLFSAIFILQEMKKHL